MHRGNGDWWRENPKKPPQEVDSAWLYAMAESQWRDLPTDSNPFTRTNMGTLTTKDGTCWTYRKHNGRIAFEHKAFAIHFVPQTGLFHLKESVETVFVAKTPEEVLESAPEAMLEHYASKFIPSWEQS